MPENICSVCNGKFEEKYFDKEQTKCILHCEKDSWYEVDNNKQKVWDEQKIELFWKHIDGIVNSINELHKIIDIKENEYELSSPLHFIKVVFPAFVHESIHYKILMYKLNIVFSECIFLDDVKIYGAYTKHNFGCSNSVFHGDLDFSGVTFKNNFNLINCKVNKLITVGNFESFVDFSQSIFNEDIEFKLTTFERLVNFKSTTFVKTLNLKSAVFKDDVNFLDIKVNMANRETARIIKDSFEQQNNIIESNKYYALEMKEREKELSPFKNLFEWLTFKIHGIASDHSQDWLLALFWIINITFLLPFIEEIIRNYESINSLLNIPVLYCIAVIVVGCFISKKQKKIRGWLIIPFTFIFILGILITF